MIINTQLQVCYFLPSYNNIMITWRSPLLYVIVVNSSWTTTQLCFMGSSVIPVVAEASQRKFIWLSPAAIWLLLLETGSHRFSRRNRLLLGQLQYASGGGCIGNASKSKRSKVAHDNIITVKLRSFRRPHTETARSTYFFHSVLLEDDALITVS